MNEQPLATISILFLNDPIFSYYLAFKNILILQQTRWLAAQRPEKASPPPQLHAMLRWKHEECWNPSPIF
jgi:hypothetical protein